jgi:hypothetical protein
VRHVLFALALVGCAKGGVGQLAQGDANEIVIDGVVYQDAPDDPHDDARVYLDAKQFEDAHVFNDAHVYMDAHVFMDAHVYMDACTMVDTELLTNGNFDAGPTVAWHEVQFDSELIVTNLPQAGAYSAWLGSYDQTASDKLYQDVVIPPGTTALTLTGYWLVGTQDSTTTAYDFSHVGLVQANAGEAAIESALTLSNVNQSGTSTYNAFNHAFNVTGLGGTTVRFKLDSQSDVTLLTNFFYDTLSLKATHCM